MSGNFRQRILEHSMPTDTSSSNSSKNEMAISQAPISFSVTLHNQHRPAPANTGPPPLACPVSICSLVFKGDTPHRYLKRHLKYPGLYGRRGDERAAWLNLHKTEYERLLSALVKLAEDNKAEEERNSRAAEFELRAKEMGITRKESIAQKVAIWEGMWAAERSGDDIQYGAGILLDAAIGDSQ